MNKDRDQQQFNIAVIAFVIVVSLLMIVLSIRRDLIRISQEQAMTRAANAVVESKP